MKAQGTLQSPVLLPSGPINMGGLVTDEHDTTFGITATGGTLDTTGEIKDDTTKQELKVITLPAKTFTVGIYAVDILDQDEVTLHTVPAPPPAEEVKTLLNRFYAPQANIKFILTYEGRLTLHLNWLAAPIPPYASTFQKTYRAKSQELLWNLAATDKDFALFWVPNLPVNVGGQAFGIPSRGALINPIYDGEQDSTTLAHEIGHCFGLLHCWTPRSDSTQRNVADVSTKRLMGYGNGKILRHKEILKIQTWTRAGTNPLGGTNPP